MATANPHDLARLRLQERLAEAAGFALRPPIYALGTPVNETGQANFKRSRQAFENLPPAREIFRPFLERVASELRKDVPAFPVNHIRMLPDGQITRQDNGGKRLFLTGDGISFKQLIARTDCPEPGAAATYLATIPAERRAKEVNTWLETTDESKLVVLRTRLALAQSGQTDDDDVVGQALPTQGLAPYGREVFAVVSDRYTTGLEVDALARMLLLALEQELMPGDARAEVTYDGRRAQLRMLWHSDIAPERVCAGEVFKGGVTVGAQDDGNLGLEVGSTLWRNLCLNLIIVQEARNKNAERRRHVGDQAELLQWLHQALVKATATMKSFAVLWSGARGDALSDQRVVRGIPAELNKLTAVGEPATHERIVKGVFRGLLKSGRLSLPAHRGETAVDRLFQSYQREPDFVKAGIVNAVSRVAHEAEFNRVWASDELEEASGRILSSTRPFDYVERGEIF